MVRRGISWLLALIMLGSALVFGLPQQAQALQYDGSASYESGIYYQRLIKVKLTGNQRKDIVAIAQSQVGYQEGSNSKQLSGEIFGKGNYTEYGRWYGLQAMWCAIFVSWAADVADVSNNVIPKHCFTPTGLQWFKDRGRSYTRAQILAGKYIPKAGDIVYFKSERNKNLTNHVGIVTGYVNGYLYTIEGNASSKGINTNGGTIARKKYSISDKYIVAVCCPAYKGGSFLEAVRTPPFRPCRCHKQKAYSDSTDDTMLFTRVTWLHIP